MKGIRPKSVIWGLVGIYVLGVAVLSLYSSSVVLPNRRELSRAGTQNFYEEKELSNSTYKFTKPNLAYKVLSKLDVFSQDNMEPYYRDRNRSTFDLKTDDKYCDKHRAYIVNSPDSIFNEINFISDMSAGSLVRNVVLPPIGATDIQPLVGTKKKVTTQYALDTSANLFVTKKAFYASMQVGKHFSCLSQMSNHIPSKQSMGGKNMVAEAINEYAKKFTDRPQCFNNKKFFPKTWILYREEDCKNFFEVFNSQEYQDLKKEKTIVYMRKIGRGAHMGSGVQPVNEKEELELRTDYGNGTLCGQVDKNYLIQEYVHDPLLIEGHKFDFRMYLLVASSNPVIAFYHDGFLRVSLMEYDITSDDKMSLLTNLALADQIYQDAKKGKLFNGMDEETLKIAQQWSFERLQNYLLKIGKITDPKWLDNYLRPEFKKAMAHLVRSVSHFYEKGSSVYALYGVDFMLDDHLNLWYIESNTSPGLGGYSQPMEKIIAKMLKDHVEVVMGLLKSRMKRVINFVNDLIEDGEASQNKKGELVIKDLDSKRAIFQKLAKNHFEPEFRPSPGNGFSKIVDENYQGVQRYQGYITEECL